MATEVKTVATSQMTTSQAESALLAQAQTMVSSWLTANQGKNIATALEVIGVICQIVEATANTAQNMGKVSSSVKADLAIQLASTVVSALYSAKPPMIIQAVYTKAQSYISDTQELKSLIDGIVAVANSAGAIQTVVADAEVAGKCLFACCGKKC
jgi:hypothetical protein